MDIDDIKQKIPAEIYTILKNNNIEELRPVQDKCIQQGLLENKSQLVYS